MYIKRYTIASLILMALVGWYVYAYVTQDTIGIELFGILLPSLSVAVWVIIPLFVLYVASVLHMSFYSMLGGFKVRKYDKDYEKIIDAIVDAYLNKAVRNHAFKTPRYKLLGKLLDETTLFLKGDVAPTTDNEKINSVIKAVDSIKNGDVVDLKAYSLLSTNQLVIQNERNRYKKGDISSEDILSRSEKYAQELCEEVYSDFAKTASLNSLEKYKKFLTKDSLLEILSRINADENNIEISNESLMVLFSGLDFQLKDYLEVSRALSRGMIPEQRIKLFETLSTTNEEAMDAYLYTLYDLEMLQPANEILDISQPNEYQNFKAYRALKECNKHFSIELFI
ncbi:MAG: hypothetical protein U9Q40_03730 [Campylobacterota bacterium]|nr:hypothetical protein [Campylobacterota bacterium]